MAYLVLQLMKPVREIMYRWRGHREMFKPYCPSCESSLSYRVASHYTRDWVLRCGICGTEDIYPKSRYRMR